MSRIRYLDVDELNDRLSELEDLERAVTDTQDELDDANADIDDGEREDIETDLRQAKANFTPAEQEELKSLRELKDEVGESRGKISTDGGPFIHEGDFEDYARELAEEIGAINKNASWPNTCIDWARAADELKMDYSVVTWAGEDYYYRP